MNRWLKRSLGTHDPMRIIKYTNISLLNNYEKLLKDTEINILRFRFNVNNQHIVGKEPNNIYFAFKQKRYNVRKKFIFNKKFKKTINNESTTNIDQKKTRLRVLVKNKFFENISDKSATINYKFFKKGKTHNEIIPVPLAKRILRTKRTLVLPAHINITLITNSYDVVHA